jgi:hypothetical protein
VTLYLTAKSSACSCVMNVFKTVVFTGGPMSVSAQDVSISGELSSISGSVPPGTISVDVKLLGFARLDHEVHGMALPDIGSTRVEADVTVTSVSVG